ncbi:MAG: hypothetical protein IKV29_00140 [Alistipes sp.]|nr:hypothetical protein [Alistipes sp.]
MQRLLSLLSIVTLLVSCVDSGEQKPMFGINPTCLEVAAIGGYFEVSYTLESANGINPVGVTQAEWIVDVDNSVEGVIGFRVLPNDSDTPREATLTLRHISTAETPQLVIKQSARKEQYLSLDITKLGYSECEVTVTPADDEMLYVVAMAEKSYFKGSNISTVEDLVAADIIQYSSYLTAGCTLEELLINNSLAMQGKQRRVWQDLSPAREYVVYAYGIYLRGDEYARVTPVEYCIVDKRLPERQEVEFGVEISAEGPEVTFCVQPNAWEGYYVVQLVEDSEAGYVEQGMPFTQEAEEQVAEAFFYIADHLYYYEERSAEEIMQQLGYKGKAEFSKTLNANHRYMALIYAVASNAGDVPMVVSRPQVEYLSTGSVERSDMTFTATFENIRPRSVDVTITPSSDEPYTAVLIYAKNLPTGDKEEQLEWVMSKYAPLELSGVYCEHISQLPPATEFILAVYGYYAGAATTDLFLYRFTTLEDGEGTNRVVSVSCTAYDLREVVALEPYYGSFMGYADYFMSIAISTELPSPALHFDIFRSDVVEEYSEAEIRESLLDYSYTSTPDWALCTYGNEYVICGLAEDENGYVGELFISEPISFLKADVSDARDFVELYRDYVN